MSPYQLSLFQRLSYGLVYLCIAALWALAPAETGWIRALYLLVGTGYLVTTFVWVGAYQRRRLTQMCAWLPIFSVLIALVGFIQTPAWYGLILLSSAPLMFLLSGWASYSRMRPLADLPYTRAGWLLALKIAFDEAMLGYFVSTAKTPARRHIPRIADEVQRTVETMEKYGWVEKPAAFHQVVSLPVEYMLKQHAALGHPFTSLSFRSNYVSHTELPGADRWESYHNTHTVHARLIEHEDGPRPWLMCVHGYRMGWPYLDFQLFSPGWLHHKLGFNLIMPLLPLHGLRKIGLRSGDGYFDGELLDLLHAEAQAMADLRACLAWLRQNREVKKLGVYGISLGGLNASLLGCLDSGIDSLIAGIPLVDPALVFSLNAPRRLVRGLAEKSVDMDVIETLLAPVSPLHMPCLVKKEGRAIIAGSYDRILPLAPIQRLQGHWDCPIQWYQGTHLSIRRERVVRQWLQEIWAEQGMLHEPPEAPVSRPLNA